VQVEVDEPVHRILSCLCGMGHNYEVVVGEIPPWYGNCGLSTVEPALSDLVVLGCAHLCTSAKTRPKVQRDARAEKYDPGINTNFAGFWRGKLARARF
jgi:hypothetical protein